MPNMTNNSTVNSANKKTNNFGNFGDGFNYDSFGKALDAVNKNSDRDYTTGFAAFGDALSGIANAYVASNGFDFTSPTKNKTTA